MNQNRAAIAITLIILAILTALLVANFLLAFIIQILARPNIYLPLKATGMASSATISRDTSGLIHIKADSAAVSFFPHKQNHKNKLKKKKKQPKKDAATAQGAAHATERLFQMDYLRRLGTGTLSEVFGKNYLAKDIFFRTLGFKAQADLEYENIDATLKTIVDAFTNVRNPQLKKKERKKNKSKKHQQRESTLFRPQPFSRLTSSLDTRSQHGLHRTLLFS